MTQPQIQPQAPVPRLSSVPAPDAAPQEPSAYEALAASFRPIFARIGEAARERERERIHADEAVKWLKAAGFSRLRLPAEYGGTEASLSHLILLLAELAEVDPSLAQAWRNHFSFIEDRVSADPGPVRDRWLAKLRDGAFIGGGWSEKSTGPVDRVDTRIIADGEDWIVTGRKFYSTGSNHADYTTVRAVTEAGDDVVALVPVAQLGVEVIDDWDGFGQQLSGSGTVVYLDARVAGPDAIPYATRYGYQGQYYQSVLNAVLVGIGRAALDEGIAALRARKRAHPNNVCPDPNEDPQLLEVIGQVAVQVRAADTLLRASLETLDELITAERSGDEDTRAALEPRSIAAVEAAQVGISEQVLDACTRIFDALGASGTSAELALDRHWRNARTLISHNPRVARARLLGEAALRAHAEGRPLF